MPLLSTLAALSLATAVVHGGPLEARLQFDRITVRDGLSSNSVRAILEDRSGFLWIGTQDGLNRYDGYTFRRYRHDAADANSPTGNFVTAAAEDPSGAIWVGTLGNGLNRLDPLTEQWRRYRHDAADPASVASDDVSVVHPSRTRPGTVWVGTKNAGLDRLDEATGIATHFRHDPASTWSLAANAVAALLEDRQGVLWVGTAKGLARLDGATGRITRVADDPSDPSSLGDSYVTALLEDRQGALWVLTATTLCRLDPQTGRITRFQHHPPGSVSLAFDILGGLVEDHAGLLWFGAFDGLYSFDPKTAQLRRVKPRPADLDGLATDRIYALTVDGRGVLWIGTYTKGLHKLAPVRNRFALYRSEADGSTLLRSDRIKSLFFDRSGVLWIGALDQGLLAFDRAAGRTTLFRHDPVDPTSLPFDIPWSYCEDSVGRFWVGTQGGGLAQLDRTTGRFVTYRHSESDPASLSDDRVWALLEDRAGRFWVATDRGLDWMDRATGTFTHLRSAPGDPFPLPVNELRYLYEAKDGAIWVSSRNEGLARLDPETGRVKLFRHDEAVPDGVPHNAINAVTEAGSTPGVLWVCTSGGGFLRLDPATGKVRAFRERDGLPNDGTYAALEDAKGFLWISTDTGIARFDPRTESFRRYDQRDGVQGNEFNGKAFGRSPTGELAFGGMDGLNVFRPETIQDDRLVPPVLITDLKVFGRSVDVSAKEGGQGILSRVVYATDEIELSWRDTVFSLEFAALDLATPDRNRYRFKLEGVDEGWTSTDATHRSATYTMLPGGRYLFRVQGTNGDGVWNEEGASLRIRVVPPFWQTSWFRGLVLFSLLVAGLAAHRLRLRAVEARRRELAQKVEERTQELTEANRRLGAANSEIAAQRDSLEASEAREVSARQTAEDASRAKSDFLSSMSHELRTPLNAIIGFSQVLIERFFGNLNEKQDEYVKDILASGQHLLSLINDILDLSKIEAGKMELARSRFLLKDLLERSLVMIREKCLRHGIGITLDVEPPVEVLEVFADERKLKQVLYNLLSNAAKFTPDGGRISVEARIIADPASGLRIVEVSVADTGVGIPVAEQERIFDPFYQVKGGLTDKTKGTGLGLPIVKRILEMHEGSVRVESAGEGQGSRFTFSLPIEGGQT